MSSFQYLGFLLFAALNYKTEREHACNSFGLLSQGLCEFVNEKPLNLEKTTSSVLSVVIN